MMLRALASIAFAATLLVATAHAQGVGGVVVMDGAGRLVGPVIGFTDAAAPDDTAIALFWISDRFLRVYVTKTAFYADGEVVFATSNCGSTPFTTAAPARPRQWFQEFALYSGWIYEAPQGSEGRTRTIRSVGTLGGLCQLKFPPVEATVYPVARVVRMPSGLWSPPFELRFR